MTRSQLLLGIGLAAALLCAAGTSHSQDKDKPKKPDDKPTFDLEAYAKFAAPGPQHKLLEPLVGSWTYKIKIYMDPSKPPIESSGRCQRKWILGGRFVQEDIVGDSKEQPFTGMGFTGYDNQQKKYTAAWLDSMGTSIVTSTGTVDAGGKIFTFTGEHFDPVMNKKLKNRDVLTIESGDRHNAVMYRVMPDGKEFKAMELTLTRAKK